jgi:ABC-2 type transport system ATP-binding protein
LSELSEVCNRIAILERGEMVAQGPLSEIMASARDESEVWVHTIDDERAAVVLRELPHVGSATHDPQKNHIVVSLTAQVDLAELSTHLHQRELAVRYLERQDPTLEEVFMTLTKGLVQ